MYDKKPENEKAIEGAWLAVADRERGELVSHDDLCRAFGSPTLYTDGPQRYYALVDGLKKRLEEERGISLVSVPMVGYALATAKEQLGLARFRATQAARRLRKGARHAGSLPDGDCSFTELRAKQAIEERLSQAERSMRGEAQRLAFLMRPREQRPRIAREDDDGMGVPAAV